MTLLSPLRLMGMLCLTLAIAMVMRVPPVEAFDEDIGETASELWDDILANSVFDVGPSTHQHIPPPRGPTGTRITFANKKSSRLEGNRVFFHNITSDNLDYVESVREIYIQETVDRPLATRSSNDQLAFWLNLHNMIVFEEIGRNYPLRSTKKLIFGEAWKTPRVYVEGRQYSLRDIEDLVFSRWRDPLVLYGLYMGAIGTPNIATTGFHGPSIWRELRLNATDFINSIRGVQAWSGYVAVSSFYDYGRALFPNFESDLRRHLMQYLDGKHYRSAVASGIRLRPTVNNWGIADLYAGYLGDSPFIGKTIVSTRTNILSQGRALPGHVIELLEKWSARFSARIPNVRIEQLPNQPEKMDLPDHLRSK